MRAAGAPPEALEPLMRRTIDNGFAPTGPHVRGDSETVESHAAATRPRSRPGSPRSTASSRRATESAARGTHA